MISRNWDPKSRKAPVLALKPKDSPMSSTKDEMVLAHFVSEKAADEFQKEWNRMHGLWV